MPNMLFANNCNTTLSSSLTNVATTMSVTSATGFPAPTGSQYFYCTLADAATQTTIEIVKVTAVSGTTFTIVRGQDGTTGTIFASGAVVSLRLVRANLNDFPKLDEDNTFAGTITFSTPLLATNMVQSTTSTSGYLSSTDWSTFNGKQAALVSGTNIKTVGGVTLLGSGDVGTIGTGYGGTGLTTFTSGGLLYASSTSALATSANLTWANSTSLLSIYGSITTPVGIALRNDNAGTSGGTKLEFGNYSGTVTAYLSNQFDGGSFNTRLWQQAAGYIAFGTNNAENVRIHNGGGVSIGNTTDPGAGSLRITGSYINSGAPASTYHLDTQTNITLYTIGSTVNFSNFSGMLIVNSTSNGDVSCYITGGGIVTKLGSTTGAIGTVVYNAAVNGVTWTNTTAGSVAVGFAIIRTRAGQ